MRRTCGQVFIQDWGGGGTQLGKVERGKIKAMKAALPRDRDGSMCVQALGYKRKH